jgi:hypothetical protein
LGFASGEEDDVNAYTYYRETRRKWWRLLSTIGGGYNPDAWRANDARIAFFARRDGLTEYDQVTVILAPDAKAPASARRLADIDGLKEVIR